jgi:hypothetical protein
LDKALALAGGFLGKSLAFSNSFALVICGFSNCCFALLSPFKADFARQPNQFSLPAIFAQTP